MRALTACLLAVVATKRIKGGAKAGSWVFLADRHLSLSWMPQLDKIVEQLQIDNIHKDFRLAELESEPGLSHRYPAVGYWDNDGDKAYYRN